MRQLDAREEARAWDVFVDAGELSKSLDGAKRAQQTARAAIDSCHVEATAGAEAAADGADLDDGGGLEDDDEAEAELKGILRSREGGGRTGRRAHRGGKNRGKRGGERRSERRGERRSG